MILVCHNAFGNLVPGDEVEVPDGHGYDHGHFYERELPPEPPAKRKAGSKASDDPSDGEE